ncbi:MAG: pilus assembly protein PilM [Erysipelotrichaceae bacterium]|nr:pilus assembly protein PilM [Erysipelotrichaceae bacterium]
MKENMLGIEIGNYTLKIVSVSQGTINGYASAQIPEGSVRDGRLIAWDAMAEVLHNVYKNGGFSTKKAGLVIPDSDTYVRRLTMPAMNEKQLAVNLPYEFHDVISDEKDKYAYDYAMISLNKDAQDKVKDMTMLGAAVSKETIEKYQELFARAGLKLIKAEPGEIALQSLIRNVSEENAEKDCALLDLGYATSRIDIFHNGIYEVTRTIDTGVRDVAKALANDQNMDEHIALQYIEQSNEKMLSSSACMNVYNTVSVEVMRALNYYTYENQNNTLDTLYYTGGGSWIQPFIQDIADTISLEMRPLSDFNEEDQAGLMHCPAALGICLE